MDRTVGGLLIPTVPLNNVLNQETEVQIARFIPVCLLSAWRTSAHLVKLPCVHMFVVCCGLLARGH